jgi:hypothetical protein
MYFLLILLPFVAAYDKFQKELPYQFPYAPNLVCDIVEHGGMYYAAVSDAFTFQRSEAVAVWPSPGRIPEACFLYHDHSYIFFFNRQTNRTDMLRNREYRSYPFPTPKRLIFDGLCTQLYLYAGNKLQRLDLAKIEALWSVEPKVMGEGETVHLFHDYQISDILVINDQLLYISTDPGLALDYNNKDRFIRTPYSKNKITQLNLATQEVEYIRSTNQSSFGFIPVSLLEEYKISSLPPLPRRPNTAADLSVLFLYIIDIAFFLLLIYIIKIKSIKGVISSPFPHLHNGHLAIGTQAAAQGSSS